MKKIFFVLLATLMIVNCKDDEDDNGGANDSNNKMEMNGSTVPLTFAEYYETDQSLNLFLTEGPYSLNGADIYFRMTNYQNLGGNYTYAEYDVQTYDPNTNFNGGGLVLNNGENIHQITGGSLSITNNGESISVDFQLVTPEGNATGHYEGAIQQRL